MQRRFYAVNGELKFESRSVLIYCAFSLPLFSRWLKVSKEAQHLPFFFPPTDNESRFLFRKINSPIKSTRLVVAVSILLLSLSICFNSKVAQQLQKIQCRSLPRPTKYISWLSQKGTYSPTDCILPRQLQKFINISHAWFLSEWEDVYIRTCISLFYYPTHSKCWSHCQNSLPYNTLGTAVVISSGGAQHTLLIGSGMRLVWSASAHTHREWWVNSPGLVNNYILIPARLLLPYSGNSVCGVASGAVRRNQSGTRR